MCVHESQMLHLLVYDLFYDVVSTSGNRVLILVQTERKPQLVSGLR